LARIDPAVVHELAPALFDGLAPVEHGAGLLLVIAFETPAPHRLAGDALYLDGVQDPGNAGALLRVAAAAQVRNVLAAPGTAALWSPKALRAGQGAHFALTIAEDVAAEQLQHWFAGPWIGTEARSARSLWETPLPNGDLGWMLGSEGAGLSPAARARCSQHVRIPLASGVESLNVATAAAVCLFERQRQHRT
jgi:TrmH family RNA methyltransferase